MGQIHGISTLRGEFGNWLLSLLYLSQVSTGSFISRHAIALKATNLSPSGLVGAPFAPWILLIFNVLVLKIMKIWKSHNIYCI